MADLINLTGPLGGVALAFALGMLIGIERGWSRRNDPEGSRVAGIRTFSLLGLAGGLAGEALHVSPILGAVLVIAAAAALLIGYGRSVETHNLSATTTIVGVITLGIGVLATNDQSVLASAAAAVTTLILSMRRQLHGWIERLSEAEVHAIARFALLSIAILPLLPDRSFGPYDAWNPRQIWMVVVLVSGFSLAGYAATRRLGESHGILATAAAGAMVSSTAVTASLAARLRKGEAAEGALAAGIALASAVMFLRVLILAAFIAPFALPALALVVGPAAVVSVAGAAWLMRRAPGTTSAAHEPAALRNPFDLAPALLLAGLVMALSLLARWVLDRYGDTGLATVLALSGMLDVDSAIITLGALPQGSLDGPAAGLALAAPVMMNTLVKAGLTITVAKGWAGWRAALPLLASILAGGLALPLLPLLKGH